jgi:hypothetical protein
MELQKFFASRLEVCKLIILGRKWGYLPCVTCKLKRCCFFLPLVVHVDLTQVGNLPFFKARNVGPPLKSRTSIWKNNSLF